MLKDWIDADEAENIYDLPRQAAEARAAGDLAAAGRRAAQAEAVGVWGAVRGRRRAALEAGIVYDAAYAATMDEIRSEWDLTTGRV